MANSQSPLTISASVSIAGLGSAFDTSVKLEVVAEVGMSPANADLLVRLERAYLRKISDGDCNTKRVVFTPARASDSKDMLQLQLQPGTTYMVAHIDHENDYYLYEVLTVEGF